MSKRRKIFVLSPHIDDAAFGLSLTISKCAHNKVDVTIINCFTITRWTAIAVDKKDVETVSALRKEEDAHFYRKIGNISIVNLDLLDAPLRNGYIFQQQPFQHNELELIETLSQLLDKLVDGILICPLGIGSHIDHAICRAAVLKLYSKVDVIFYEDLPYARRITPDQLLEHISRLENELGTTLTNNTYDLLKCTIDKEQAIRLYQSQMNDEIASEIMAHLNALKGERLWGEEKYIMEIQEMLK